MDAGPETPGPDPGPGPGPAFPLVMLDLGVKPDTAAQTCAVAIIRPNPVRFSKVLTKTSMRRLILIAVLAAAPAVGAAQTLTCATAASGDCTLVHYHVRVWDPRTKASYEILGQNDFATMETCEAARARDEARNRLAIDHLFRVSPRMKTAANVYGACHCDPTWTKGDPGFLTEPARLQVHRAARSVDLAMLNLLVERDLAADSDLARRFEPTPSTFRSADWPLGVVRPVAPGADHSLGETEEPAMETTIIVQAPVDAEPTRLALKEITYADLAGITVTEAAAAPAATRSDFLGSEIQRFAALLDRVDQFAQQDVVIESCQERVQVLSNLQRLIETAGPSSRLARANQERLDETDRLRLIGELFGETVAAHWAPADPAGMSISIPEVIDGDPLAVLRDSGEKFDASQRKLALYRFLAGDANLTESQEAWLASLIEKQIPREDP